MKTHFDTKVTGILEMAILLVFFKGLISLIFPAHTIPVSLFLLKSNVRTPWAYTRDIGLTIQFLQFPLTTQEMDPRQC